MQSTRLDDILKDWFQTAVESAPAEDPRRTSDCLRFAELPLAADSASSLGRKKRDHVVRCNWCTRAVNIYRATHQILSVSIPDTAPRGAVPDALWQFARKWFRDHEPAPDQPVTVYFDADGTLHVALSGLAQQGSVRVRLVADEYPIAVADAEVHEGNLNLIHPMPELGLTNLRIAEEALELVLV